MRIKESKGVVSRIEKSAGGRKSIMELMYASFVASTIKKYGARSDQAVRARAYLAFMLARPEGQTIH